VGFATQICTAHTTAVSGTDTTLHMTIQPRCKVNDNDPQGWLICSWKRDPQSPLCAARPEVDGYGECCQYINAFIAPPLDVTNPELSCQEYVEGDCNTFYGYSGAGKGDATAIEEYAIELVSCSGAHLWRCPG